MNTNIVLNKLFILSRYYGYEDGVVTDLHLHTGQLSAPRETPASHGYTHLIGGQTPGGRVVLGTAEVTSGDLVVDGVVGIAVVATVVFTVVCGVVKPANMGIMQ